MAKVSEWQEAINKLSPGEAARKAEAILELGTWKFFEDAFKHMGIETLYFILNARGKEGK